ncbi:MAG: glycosyltransferase family 2 protein [Candidatus Omnitrophota bacterium]
MKCQIIIVVWNQFEVTKNCLESILEKTKAPFEIILVDNASEEKTASYLKNFSSRYQDKVRLIRNNSNLGFIKAVNQAMGSATADFVCLLNNDTIVAENWLNELIFVAQNNPTIGLLNPSSNTLGQKTEVENIDNFAQGLSKYHGQFEEMAQASGFCMLIKKEVIQKIGTLDEVYGMGYFEDTDYSRRAMKNGFRCARAIAGYVYHCEKTSFLKMPGHNSAFKKNQELFYKRWEKPKRIFVEVKKGLLSKYVGKLKSLAKNGDWILIAKKENVRLPSFNHTNIKEISFSEKNFDLKCFFKIIKRTKKKYDYLVIQSPVLRRMLAFFKFFHKAKVLSLRKLEEL